MHECFQTLLYGPLQPFVSSCLAGFGCWNKVGSWPKSPPCIGRGVPCKGGHMLCDSKRKHCLSSLPWDSQLLSSCFCGVKCGQERKRNILSELTSAVRPQWSDGVVLWSPESSGVPRKPPWVGWRRHFGEGSKPSSYHFNEISPDFIILNCSPTLHFYAYA